MVTIDQVNLMKMSAAEGTFTVNDAIANAKDFISIYVGEDTVVASIFLNGGATNVVGNYIKSPDVAVKGGTIIAIGTKAGYGSSITLTSGSVTLILK